jgi:RNA processing factor Prp31
VESRMTFIAPNLSVIVGASVAAKVRNEASTHLNRARCTRKTQE